MSEMASFPAGGVLEHFRAPRNSGRFPAGTGAVAEGRAGEIRHGRAIRFQLQIGRDARIAACRYQVYGCPATIALCSLASERLPGLSLEQALGWRALALAEELGLPAEKRAAALVLEDAVRAAVRSYNMHPQPVAAAAETGRS